MNDTSNKRLKTAAYAVTIFFAFLVLFPLAFMLVSSLKDRKEIGQFPPSLLPKPAKSLAVVADYDAFPALAGEELLDLVKRDAVLAQYAVVYEEDSEAVKEIRFYGVRAGKQIYFSRAHTEQLRMEMTYGTYKKIRPNRMTLLYGDRYKKAAEAVGYRYTPEGTALELRSGAPEAPELCARVGDFLAGKYQLSGALRPVAASFDNLLFLESYKNYWMLPTYVFSEDQSLRQLGFLVFIGNTLLVILIALVSQIFLCSLPAYAVSMLLPRRTGSVVLLFFLLTMMIPFISILLPQIVLIRDLGLLNSYAGMLLPYMVPSGFFVYLFKGFFDQLPKDLFEAAKIDGAGELFVFSRLALPLSKSIIAVVSINIFLGAWNDFFWFYMAANKPGLWTINLALYNFSLGSADQNVLMGLSILAVVPVVAVVLALSRKIQASVAFAGIKG